MNSFLSSLFKNQEEQLYTVAMYNVENLFDTVDNPLKADDEFTPKGKKHWNNRRYKDKVKKLSSVISQLGTEKSKLPPILVGLVEVENKAVISDLIIQKHLKNFPYDFVHYDSKDERGIDVALLYNKQHFELISSKNYPLLLEDSEGNPDFTRDVLHVSGKLKGELIHVLVNHWPSRREGEEETRPNRIKAAKLNQQIIAEIHKTDIDAKIIIMGDFNDDPTSPSVKQHLVTDSFYNPMESILAKGTGTLTYNQKWNLFDQIILSKNFLDKSAPLHFTYAAVFNKKWLRIYKGKLKDSPFRTYIGPWYQGGFSDHFPVYVYLKKK